MRGTCLAVLAAVALIVVGGCSESNPGSGENGGGDTSGQKPPKLRKLPDMREMRADKAVRKLRRLRLTATFQEKIDPLKSGEIHRSDCTVRSHDPDHGRFRRGTMILLRLDCPVFIPDLTGATARVAARTLERARSGYAFNPEPDDKDACTVTGQDAYGKVADAPIVFVDLTCPPPPPPTGEECEPSYPDVCLDPNVEDYDCADGEGDGPEYVEGPIRVEGEDPFDLDANEDGEACE